MCLGPGAGRRRRHRRPVLGGAGRSEAETRLKPGDLYPSTAAAEKKGPVAPRRESLINGTDGFHGRVIA